MNEDFTKINPPKHNNTIISSHGSNRLLLNSVGSSFLQKRPLIKQRTDGKRVQFITASSLINPISEVQMLQLQYRQINSHRNPSSFTRERNYTDSMNKYQKDEQNAEELVSQRQKQDQSIINHDSFKSIQDSSSSIEKNICNRDFGSQFNSNSSSFKNKFMPSPPDQLILYQNQTFKTKSNKGEISASIQSISQLSHWPKTFILVIIVISRMLKKARMIRKIQNVNRMTYEQFIVINDLSSSFNVIKRIKKQKLINLLYYDACLIIYASFKFMIIWNIIMLFLYLSSVFLIPTYEIIDQHGLKDQHFQVLFLFFIVNNMININSIRLIKLNFENIYLQQKRIKQLKNNIKYDLIIFTTLLAYYVSGDIHLVFTIMLLIFSINNIFKQIYEKFNLQKARRFANCIFVYTIMNHYSALIWMYFIIIPSQNSLYDSYIQSIHYIMIGTQTQKSEQMSSSYYLGDCLLKIKTFIIISFVVIQIYNYLQNNNSNGFQASIQFYEKLGLTYQTLRNLITILRYRYENRGIQNNHELNVINDNGRDQKKDIFMISNSNFRQQVGNQIVDQIQIDLFLNVIQNSKVIKNLCSNQCVKVLCNKIEICQFNENDKNDLYFLISGIAQKVLTQPNVKLETIKAKAILNEISFLNQQKCDCRYDFSSKCKFGRLSFIDFIETLRQYPQGFQIYYMFRENSLFNQSDLRRIFNCPICKSHQHSLKSCQATTLLFDRHELIKENQRLIQNKRQNYARNNTIRFNTLNNKSYIQISVIGFGLEQHIYREKDMTNEVLNILKGNSSSNNSGFSVLNTQTIDFNSSLGITPSIQQIGSNRKQSNISNSVSIPRSMTKNSEKSQSPIQNSSSPKKSSIQEIELNRNEEIFHDEKSEFDFSDLTHSYHYYFPANNLDCILRQLQRNSLIRNKRIQGEKSHNNSIRY